jgi:predicted YcjX-like family ATPase
VSKNPGKFVFALSLAGVMTTHAAPVLAQTPPAAAPSAPQSESTSQTLDRAYAAYVEANRRFETAQKRVAEGRESLPGERAGLAGGGSRLRPEYYERQEKLKQDLEAARAGLEDARGRWNALR